MGRALTDEQKEKQRLVKLINERVRTLEKSELFGPNSPEYKAAKDRLEVAAGSTPNSLTTTGYLKRNKGVLDSISLDQLRGMLQQKTATQYQREYTEGAKREYDTENPTKEEVQEYRELMLDVNKLIKKYSGFVSEAVRTNDLHGAQSTPEEWREALMATVAKSENGGDTSVSESMEGDISSYYFSSDKALEEGKENYDPEEA